MNKIIIIIIGIIILLFLGLGIFILFNKSEDDTSNETSNEEAINKLNNNENNVNLPETENTKIVENIENENNIESVENNIEGENMNINQNEIKVNLIINNQTFTATLENNETTRKLIEKFPLTLNMEDLHLNEKYYYLDKSLPTNSYTPSTINKGDIMLYGNNCLVVFYDTFRNSYSYTRLGKIDNTEGLENALERGNVNIRFELSN